MKVVHIDCLLEIFYQREYRNKNNHNSFQYLDIEYFISIINLV
jgi:hypothetical protein